MRLLPGEKFNCICQSCFWSGGDLLHICALQGQGLEIITESVFFFFFRYEVGICKHQIFGVKTQSLVISQ